MRSCHHRLGLVAANARRLAGVAVRRRPGGRVVVERARRLRRRRVAAHGLPLRAKPRCTASRRAGSQTPASGARRLRTARTFSALKWRSQQQSAAAGHASAARRQPAPALHAPDRATAPPGARPSTASAPPVCTRRPRRRMRRTQAGTLVSAGGSRTLPPRTLSMTSSARVAGEGAPSVERLEERRRRSRTDRRARRRARRGTARAPCSRACPSSCRRASAACRATPRATAGCGSAARGSSRFVAVVARARCSRDDALRARPKSVTRARPSAPMSTLSGLKSRCTRPAACAAASPRPAPRNSVRISRQLRVGRSHALSVPASTSSIAKKTRPPIDADVVHGDDVGVRQARHRLRLAQHARREARLVAAEIAAQQLERDLAIELRIVRGVDHAHAARAEPIEHEIAAERGAALELVVDCEDRATTRARLAGGWPRPSARSSRSAAGRRRSPTDGARPSPTPPRRADRPRRPPSQPRSDTPRDHFTTVSTSRFTPGAATPDTRAAGPRRSRGEHVAAVAAFLRRWAPDERSS